MDFSCKDARLEEATTALLEAMERRKLLISEALLKFITLPTGTGKTHLISHIYVVKCLELPAPGRHHVGIHIGPLKEHLRLPVKDVRIKIYQYFGQDSLCEDPVLTDVSNKLVTLKRIFSTLRQAEDPVLADRAKKAYKACTELGIHRSDLINAQIQLQRNFAPAHDEIPLSDPEAAVKDAKRGIKHCILRIGENIGHMTVILPEIIDQHAELDHILGLTFPLQIASYKPCIIVLTCKKSDVTTKFFRDSKKGPISSSCDILTLLRKAPLGVRAQQSPLEHVDFVIGIDESDACFSDIHSFLCDDFVKSRLLAQAASAFRQNTASVYPNVQNLMDREYRTIMGEISTLSIGNLNLHSAVTARGRAHLVGLVSSQCGVSVPTAEHFVSLCARHPDPKAVVQYAALFTHTIECLELGQLAPEKFWHFLNIFSDKLAIHIPKQVLSEYSESLGNIFAANPLDMMSKTELEALRLKEPQPWLTTVEIEARKGPIQDSFTLRDLVHSAITMLHILAEVKKGHYILANIEALDHAHVPSRSAILKNYVGLSHLPQLSAPIVEGGQTIDEQYVYRTLDKLIISLSRIEGGHSIRGVASELSPDTNEIGLSLVSMHASPEEWVLDLATKGNSVFLLSNTGMIRSNYGVNFDIGYFERMGHQRNITVETEDKRLDALAEGITRYRRSQRDIKVDVKDYAALPFADSSLAVALNQCIIQIERVNPAKIAVLNPYKRAEILGLFHALLGEESMNVQSTMYVTQKISNIKAIFENLSMRPIGSLSATKGDDYGASWTLWYKNRPIRVVFFESGYREKYEAEKESSFDELFRIRKGESVALVTSFGAAARGLTFVVKPEGGDEGGEDFQQLIMPTDPFYSKLMSNGRDGADEADLLKKIALMRHCVKENIAVKFENFHEVTRTDPLFDAFLHQQHLLQRALTIVQVLGRTERRDAPEQKTSIILNHESIMVLTDFFEHIEMHQPAYLKNLSANASEVNEYIKSNRLSFKDDVERNSFRETQFDHADTYSILMKEKLLPAMSSGRLEGRKLWERLRIGNPFSDVEKYLDDLIDSGLFNTADVDSFFLSEEESAMRLYIIERCGDDEVPIEILGDYHTASRERKLAAVYRPLERLGLPHSLLNSSHQDIQDVIRRTGIDWQRCFTRRKPRPHFIMNVLKGLVGEIIVKAYIEHTINRPIFQQERLALFGPKEYARFPYLYEMGGDFFLVAGNTLFGFDAKHVGKNTANRRFTQKKISELFMAGKFQRLQRARQELGVEHIVYYYAIPYARNGYDRFFIETPIEHNLALYGMCIASGQDQLSQRFHNDLIKALS